METKTKKNSTLKSTGIVSVVTLASRILGMLRDSMIASFFGAGLLTDAFFVAFRIPNLFRRLSAEGALASAFVPIFSEEFEKDKSAAKLAFRQSSTLSLIITGVLSILGMIFSDELIMLFAPGFEKESQSFLLSSTMLRIMFPYLLIVSMSAIFGSALNVLGFYAISAAVPALLNVGIIFTIIAFRGQISPEIYSVCYGVIIGGLFGLFSSWHSLRNKGFTYYPVSIKKSKTVNQLIKLVIPAIFSASIYQIGIFLNTLFASLLEEGSISWLYYSDRLVQFPLGIFSIALATAVLPLLSKLSAKNDLEKFSAELARGISWVSLICFPASLGLIVLSEEISRVIYDYGNFGEESLLQTSAALSASAAGLWATSAQIILVRAYLARKNTKIPAKVAGISLIFNIYFSIALMGESSSISNNEFDLSSFSGLILYAQDLLSLAKLGHVGLALAASISSGISVVLLLTQISKIGIDFKLGKQLYSNLASLLSSIIMFIALKYLLSLNLIDNKFLKVLILTVTGALIFLISNLSLRNYETKEILNRLLKRKS